MIADIKHRIIRRLGYPRLLQYTGSQPLPNLERTVSQVCTESQFGSATYKFWCEQIKETPRFHRKQWEFVYVLQTLKLHEKLAPGSVGIGFGVGKEPTVAVMANMGCNILASDLSPDAPGVEEWRASNQHAGQLGALNERGICDPVTFRDNVRYESIDMNNVGPQYKKGGFDFLWSSCSLEHLGSIQQGKEFIIDTLGCLRPGGVAVHTTEYNVSSTTATMDNGPTVIFRRTDIESIIDQANQRGYTMEINWNHGSGVLDRNYDVPPYGGDDHVKLLLGDFISTSIGLIIQKSK